jgi:hypothetical protein
MFVIGILGMSVLQRLPQEALTSDVLNGVNQIAQENNVVAPVLAQDAADPEPPAAPAPAPAPNAEADKSADSSADATARLQNLLSGGANAIAQVAVFLMKIMGAFLMFMLYWMSDLMDSTFILDGAMGEKLQTIWIFVRNMVNIVFAILLVGVAFVNVAGYGGGEGNYALKKFIPKMALALIAVNFTFLAARVVLDVNNVLTTAVFALPDSVSSLSDYTATSQQPIKMYVKWNCTLDSAKAKQDSARVEEAAKEIGATVSAVGVQGAESGAFNSSTPIANFFNICVADLAGSEAAAPDSTPKGTVEVGTANQITKNNFVWVMATRYQGLQNLAKVPLEAKDWEALISNASFSLVFAVIYAVAYIAMFIILIIRVVVLWVCIALSPLIAIEILFPELAGSLSKIGEGGLKGMFLDHALVPLKMAVPLSIGFVMIDQMSLLSASSFGGDILITGGEFTRGGSFQRILYGIASAALVWIGVFAATSSIKGHEIIDKMKGGVENFGKFLGKIPLQTIPIVPIGEGLSLSALGSAAKAVTRFPSEQAERMGSQFGRSLLPGYDSERSSVALKGINKENTPQMVRDHWQKADSTARHEALGKIATAFGMGDKIQEAIKQSKSSDEFFAKEDSKEFIRLLGATGLNRESFMGGAAGVAGVTAGAQTGVAEVASGIMGDKKTISITLPVAATIGGTKFEVGKSASLTPEQFKGLIEQYRPGDFGELLKDDKNKVLRDAILANTRILDGLANNSQKNLWAEEIMQAFQGKNLSEAQQNDLVKQLQVLGVSEAAARAGLATDKASGNAPS